MDQEREREERERGPRETKKQSAFTLHMTVPTAGEREREIERDR